MGINGLIYKDQTLLWVAKTGMAQGMDSKEGIHEMQKKIEAQVRVAQRVYILGINSTECYATASTQSVSCILIHTAVW